MDNGSCKGHKCVLLSFRDSQYLDVCVNKLDLFVASEFHSMRAHWMFSIPERSMFRLLLL